MTGESFSQRLRSIKVLLLDADGVFFDGFETRNVHPDGTVTLSKRRHYHDGQGISFLRGCGLRIKFVTGEGEPLMSIVDKLNGLPSVKNGSWAPVHLSSGQNAKGGKLAVIERWLHEEGFNWGDCAYIGDDVNDHEAMLRVSSEGGLAVAPANATRVIREVVDWQLRKDGGNGAIREFAELVLDARGIDERILPPA